MSALASSAPGHVMVVLAVVAALAAGSALLTASLVGVAGPAAVVTIGVIGLLALAADVDRRELRLPDVLVGLAAVPVLGLMVVALMTGRIDAVGAIVVGALLAGTPVAALHLAAPAAMGFGDVKTAVVLGAALGVIEWRLSLLAVAAASGMAIVGAVLSRRRAVAFGPYLVAGGYLVLVVGRLIDVGPVPWR